METFWRYGYAGASISALTSDMGITAPSLYAAFGDKESLYIAAVDWYLRQPSHDLKLLLKSTSTAYEAIEAILFSAAKQQTRPGSPQGCMLMSAFVSSPVASSVEKYLISARQNIQTLIEKRIRRGINEGDVPSSVVAADLARFYIMVLQGMSVQARDGAGQTELSTLAKQSLAAWPMRKPLVASEAQ